MKIRNTHNEIIDVECDRCRQPLTRDKNRCYIGLIIVEIPEIKEKDYCYSCANYIKELLK